ncbi:glycosyltransferase family 39 protein [Legionella longbeachae]|uniref:glycosyltransferase family 39 protein n=1 Tax=Legionella longbeachae TaxID=450 RepID=UPI0012492B34|nr:glycosyltransferase family 39 protein [Legionella longbeachae]QEY51000.1 dolichol monophosphate mannose synthase [Legionella longbeachae]
MWNEKVTKPFLIFYLIFLFIATFFLTPTITSFYYYAWGKHLAWSYFDGPPMIAYLFSISNAIFGNTFFSVNIVGFVCLSVSAYYIYKIGCLFDQRVGLISALIWIVLPTTTESIFVRVLYDAPLNLFTILSFYYFARYISLKRILDLYLSAFFTGAMILSKYTAVVSIIGLLVFILFSKNRQLFKSKHFYLASMIILIMAMPVIYWNASHKWISITYLLNFHSHAQSNTSVTHYFLELLFVLLINFSVFLFLAVFGWFKYQKCKKTEGNEVLELTYAVLFVGLAFWVGVALLGGDARAIYLTPLGMNFALIAAYHISQFQYQRIFIIIYSFFLLFSIILIFVNSWPIASYLKKGRTYSILQEALSKPEIIKREQPIVSSYFSNAAALSFFRPNASVYAIPCGDINQYQYWGAEFLNDLSKGKIDKISYVDFWDSKQCAERFFNKCQAVATLSHHKMIPIIHKLTKPVYLFVYECSFPRKQV